MINTLTKPKMKMQKDKRAEVETGCAKIYISRVKHSKHVYTWTDLKF